MATEIFDSCCCGADTVPDPCEVCDDVPEELTVVFSGGTCARPVSGTPYTMTFNGSLAWVYGPDGNNMRIAMGCTTILGVKHYSLSCAINGTAYAIGGTAAAGGGNVCSPFAFTFPITDPNAGGFFAWNSTSPAGAPCAGGVVPTSATVTG